MGFFDALIRGASTIGGALIGSRANERAADTASAAAIRAAEIEQEGARQAREAYEAAAQRGIGAIREGTRGFEETIRPLTVPVTALTPAQRIALDDQTSEDNATLAASGLRGAGRAGVAAVMDNRRRFTADALDENRRRSDAALSALANIRAQEGGAIASTEIGAGNQIGSTFTTAAQSGAGGVRDAGLVGAQSQLASGRLTGEALGSLGSIIADEIKGIRVGRYDNARPREV